ncbi:alpha/beta hydrolase [Desulfobacula sp.]|uniref:alpha/beta fold hydrolase n=1 Tax=Desulfobacula sp. TaxID=2593537 RepID=UPI002617B1BC|nr:alpha/beta hydrolase [Desulfobacula sp.]
MDITPGYTVCGQGPATVLLHSSMSSKDQWKPLISLLAAKFKFISIDLSGYGDNGLPLNHQTFSTEDEVRLAQRIMTKEMGNETPFHLIGHSYGGAIALKLAVKMLDRVKTLTLFEPVTFHLLPPEEAAHKEITKIREQFTHALIEKDKAVATQLFIDYWSGKETFTNLVPKNQALYIRYIEKVLLDFQALFNESLTLEDYSGIHIPVCMIKGETSPLSSLQVFRILERSLPYLSSYSVPGGHMAPITHFKTVNTIIEKFLISQAY